jgi:hypothetical protein
VGPSLETYQRVRAEVGPDCLIVVRWYHVVQDVSARGAERLGLVASAPGLDREHNRRRTALSTRAERNRGLTGTAVRQFRAGEAATAAFSRAQGVCPEHSVGTPDLNIWPVIRADAGRACATEMWLAPRVLERPRDIENVWHVRRFTLLAVAANLQGKQIVITEAGATSSKAAASPAGC